ncbi:hypothetical protein KSB_17000 [Ktedonobacter robiniae]|uniref:Uncharacterized protein n=1 Tax=Ktedonobacter robiniae TaxID=2778365 RepID=A0ABQ3UKN7_9CHLR|nr:hypothetical protein KSB_17000 [Ktedonobacter robiniae]
MRENMNCTLRVGVDFSLFVIYSVFYTPTGGVWIAIYTLVVMRMLCVGSMLAWALSEATFPKQEYQPADIPKINHGS